MLKVTSLKEVIVLLVLRAILHQALAYQGCPDIDPMDQTIHLPHETNCSLFYRCDHGYPKLDACPGGLHFNPVLQVCDWPDQAGCANKSKCQPLENGKSSWWVPSTCTERPGESNDLCTLVCATGFEHSGGETVTCRSDGWFAQNTVDQLPTCFLITDLGDLIVDQINETLGGRDASFLFLLDESGSVDPSEFVLEIRFMNSLVSGFPLSAKRASGAITFASFADVDIHMNETNTCSFLDRAKLITYSSGGTDILNALQTAIKEIKSYSLHNLTLVFLVTDGQSSDPSSAADQLKANGDVLFTVGVAGYSAQQLIPISSLDKAGNPLFYGIDSFSIFEKVAEYLETKFNPDAIGCGVNP